MGGPREPQGGGPWEAEIRQFLLRLQERGESASSLKLYVASIRFLYAVTLERPAEVASIPWPRVVQKLPAVVSRTEVLALLGKIEPLVCRMVVMTAYGTGLRISEVLALEPGTSTATLGSPTFVGERAAAPIW